METHDWEVWVKNPSGDKIEAFLEKVGGGGGTPTVGVVVVVVVVW